MVKMNVYFYLASLILLTSAAELFDRQLIENKLEDVAWEVLFMEETLIKSLTYFGLQVKYASSNLKASNLPKTFTDVLDNLMVAIQAMQTVNDNQKIPFTSLHSLDDYNYAQFRVATTSSDTKFYQTIINHIQVNETKLLEFARNVTSNYVINYTTISSLRSKDITTTAVIRHFLVIFRGFGLYQRLLTVHADNAARISSFLSDLIVSKRLLLPANTTLDPVVAKLKAIESVLVPLEKQVKVDSQNARNKVALARQSVSSSRLTRSADNSKFNWDNLVALLDGVSSVNDYSNVGWPVLPDLPADGRKLTIVLRCTMCEDKQRSYDFIQDNARKNRTSIFENRQALNSATPTVSSAGNKRKVQAQSQSVLDLMESLKTVETSLGAYDSAIEAKKTEVARMTQNLTKAIDAIPDPISMLTTRRTTTTVTYPSTTLETFPPCGTFLPYRPVVSDAALKSNGVVAGYCLDGTPTYVGRGDNSAYKGLKPCAARIKPGVNGGAIMIGGNKTIFDNKTAEYLAFHPDIYFLKVNHTDAMNNSEAIKWMTGNITNMIGIVNVLNYTTIGRVNYGDGLTGMYYYQTYKETFSKTLAGSSFTVVGCRTTPRAYPPCGTFVPYRPVIDSVALTYNGVSAGIYYNGIPAYVGRGDNSAYKGMQRCAARIQPDFGAYMATNSGTTFDNKTAEYLTYHPNLSWYTVNASTAMNHPNAIKWTTGNFTMMIGSYNINMNYTAIGRVNFGDGLSGMSFYRVVAKTVSNLMANATFQLIGCK